MDRPIARAELLPRLLELDLCARLHLPHFICQLRVWSIEISSISLKRKMSHLDNGVRAQLQSKNCLVAEGIKESFAHPHYPAKPLDDKP